MSKTTPTTTPTNTTSVLYKKPCKYIGSVAVPKRHNDERQQFIKDKFEEMKNVVKGIPVVIIVTDEGIKILKEDESTVKMAHGVARILFSTCQADLFAYVAKTVTSDQRSVIQAHIFKTKKVVHTSELNTSLMSAFKIAADKPSVIRKKEAKNFDVEAAANQKSEIKGKRWAKQELARGHQHAAHAQQANRKISETQKTNLPQGSSAQQANRRISETQRTDMSQVQVQIARSFSIGNSTADTTTQLVHPPTANRSAEVSVLQSELAPGVTAVDPPAPGLVNYEEPELPSRKTSTNVSKVSLTGEPPTLPPPNSHPILSAGGDEPPALPPLSSHPARRRISQTRGRRVSVEVNPPPPLTISSGVTLEENLVENVEDMNANNISETVSSNTEELLIYDEPETHGEETATVVDDGVRTTVETTNHEPQTTVETANYEPQNASTNEPPPQPTYENHQQDSSTLEQQGQQQGQQQQNHQQTGDDEDSGSESPNEYFEVEEDVEEPNDNVVRHIEPETSTNDAAALIGDTSKVPPKKDDTEVKQNENIPDHELKRIKSRRLSLQQMRSQQRVADHVSDLDSSFDIYEDPAERFSTVQPEPLNISSAKNFTAHPPIEEPPGGSALDDEEDPEYSKTPEEYVELAKEGNDHEEFTESSALIRRHTSPAPSISEDNTVVDESCSRINSYPKSRRPLPALPSEGSECAEPVIPQHNTKLNSAAASAPDVISLTPRPLPEPCSPPVHPTARPLPDIPSSAPRRPLPDAGTVDQAVVNPVPPTSRPLPTPVVLLQPSPNTIPPTARPLPTPTAPPPVLSPTERPLPPRPREALPPPPPQLPQREVPAPQPPQPHQPPTKPPRHTKRPILTEEQLLNQSEWYRLSDSRNQAEARLASCEMGSFVIRKSQSLVGTLVLTVKIPTSVKATGFGNFLVEAVEGNYKLKEFTQRFNTLTDLIVHYATHRQDIPLMLNLGLNDTLIEEKLRQLEEELEEEGEEEVELNDYDYELYQCSDGMLDELAGLPS